MNHNTAIRAEELRIGNWVIVEEGDPIQVVDVLCDSVNTAKHQGMPYEFVFGIPLSEQVLLDCGFEKTDSDYYFQQHIWINKTGFKIAVDDVEFTVGLPYMMCNELQRPMYLHQLQNLILLFTGTELIYKR